MTVGVYDVSTLSPYVDKICTSDDAGDCAAAATAAATVAALLLAVAPDKAAIKN